MFHGSHIFLHDIFYKSSLFRLFVGQANPVMDPRRPCGAFLFCYHNRSVLSADADLDVRAAAPEARGRAGVFDNAVDSVRL